jgi:hypothetical protein
VTGSPALAKMIGIPAAAPTYTGECLALEDRFHDRRRRGPGRGDPGQDPLQSGPALVGSSRTPQPPRSFESPALYSRKRGKLQKENLRGRGAEAPFTSGGGPEGCPIRLCRNPAPLP